MSESRCRDPPPTGRPELTGGRRGAGVFARAKTTEQLTISDCQVGCPIRRSRDQRVLSPPPGLSQSATSFIASCCQGIHQTPLSRLIRSRRRRALLRGSRFKAANPSQAWDQKSRPGADPRQEDRPVQQAPNGPSRNQTELTVSVYDLERLFWLSYRFASHEDSCPRAALRRNVSRPPLGPDPKRLVFCSLHDVR